MAMRAGFIGMVGAVFLLAVAGCQGLSQVGQAGALQSASRVPPPGTGTYAVPRGSYNPTTAATGTATNPAYPAATLATGAVGSQVAPAGFSNNLNWQIPATSEYRTNLANSANAAMGDMQNRLNQVEASANQVIQAGASTVANTASQAAAATNAMANQFAIPNPTLGAPAPTYSFQAADDADVGDAEAAQLLNWQVPR
jgi:hypothetical protein